MTEEEYEKKIRDLEWQLNYMEQRLHKLARTTNGLASWGEGLMDDEKDEANREACKSLFRSNLRDWNSMKGICLPKPKPLSESVYPSGRYHGD